MTNRLVGNALTDCAMLLGNYTKKEKNMKLYLIFLANLTNNCLPSLKPYTLSMAIH